MTSHENFNTLEQILKSKTRLSRFKIKKLCSGRSITMDLQEAIEVSECTDRITEPTRARRDCEIEEQLENVRQGCNIAKVARISGIQRSRLWRILNNKAKIKLEDALRLRDSGLLEF